MFTLTHQSTVYGKNISSMWSGTSCEVFFAWPFKDEGNTFSMPLLCFPVPLTPKKVVNTSVFGILNGTYHTHTWIHMTRLNGLAFLFFLWFFLVNYDNLLPPPPPWNLRETSTVIWLLFLTIRKEIQFPLPFGVKVFRRKSIFCSNHWRTLSGMHGMGLPFGSEQQIPTLAGHILPLGW